MPFQPVLEAFGGNLKIVGTSASTANQHMPHFADDRPPRAALDAILGLEIDEAMRIAAMRGDLVLRVNPWHENNSIIFRLLDLLMAGTVETPALADFID